MEMVVTSELKQDSDNVLRLDFNFFSAPGMLNTFKHVPHTFLDVCEEIMLRSWIPISRSATVNQTFNPKTLIDFGNGDFVSPSRMIQIRYQVSEMMTEIYDNVVPYRHKPRNKENSSIMYEGIPELFDFVIGLIEYKPVHDSWAIFAYHLLSELLKAAHHALVHYFTLTLNENFLQNSQIGTPYQKWAKFTNDDFQAVDKCLKALLPVINHMYSEISCVDYSYGGGSTRSEWKWMETLNKKYTCCQINRDKPSLTLSTINFDGWLEHSRKKFGKVYSFKTAPVVIKTELHIADRSILIEQMKVGKARFNNMRDSLARLAKWLEVNYTMAEVTATRRLDEIVDYSVKHT